MSNLAVRLDEPLLSPALNRRPPPMAMFKYLLGVFLSDAFKFAVVAFLIGFVMSIVARSDLALSAPKGLADKAAGGVASLLRPRRLTLRWGPDAVRTGTGGECASHAGQAS